MTWFTPLSPPPYFSILQEVVFCKSLLVQFYNIQYSDESFTLLKHLQWSINYQYMDMEALVFEAQHMGILQVNDYVHDQEL